MPESSGFPVILAYARIQWFQCAGLDIDLRRYDELIRASLDIPAF
jgi:hypothetical protein